MPPSLTSDSYSFLPPAITPSAGFVEGLGDVDVRTDDFDEVVVSMAKIIIIVFILFYLVQKDINN